MTAEGRAPGGREGKGRIASVLSGKGAGPAPSLLRPGPGFLLRAFGGDPAAFYLDGKTAREAADRLAREAGPQALVLAGAAAGARPEGEVLETLGEADFFQVLLRGGGRIEFPIQGKPRFFDEAGRPPGAGREDLDPEDLFYLDPYAPWAWSARIQRAWRKAGRPEGTAPALEEAARRAGGDYGLVGYLLDPPGQLLELLGFQGWAELLLTEPELLEACLESLAEGTVRAGAALAEAGAEALLLDSPHSGADSLSLRAWREKAGPCLEAVLQGLRREAGAPVILGLPSLAADRLGDFLALGSEGILAPPPPPEGDLPWPLPAETPGREGKAVPAGGVGPGQAAREDRDRLARRVRELRREMEGGRRGRPWILAVSGELLPGTPLENLRALAE